MIMKKQCYTIVELLVVIAIMAIIIGISVPGLNNLINGNRVERAAKQLAAAIGKARSEAIVSNRKVALLLPVRQDNNYIKSEYLHKSYAIVFLDRNGDKLNTARTNDFKWERLSGGAVFLVTKDLDKDTFFDENGNLKDKNKAVFGTNTKNLAKDDMFGEDFDAGVKPKVQKNYKRIFKKNTSDDNSGVNYIIFNPDGTLDKEICFYFVDALVDSNGNILTEEILNKESAANKKRPAGTIAFEVNQFTGRVKYENLYE